MHKYYLVGLIPKDKGSGGGAWLGTYRLFLGLNKILGKDKVKLYVAIKNLNKNFINTIYPFGLSKFFYLKMALISKIINTLILKNKNKTHFSFNLIPTLLDLKLYLSSKKGNNIYLHWLGNNFASIWLIYVITMRKNILIKFADYWWLTGGCHYPKNCNAFERNKCIDCPAVKKNFRWIPKILFKIKMSILNKKNVNIISPSKHLFNTAKKLTSNKKIFYISNGLEIADYVQRDYRKVSIGVISQGFDDPRKNLSQVKNIIDLLLKESDLTINLCGNSTKMILPFNYMNLNLNINNFGFLKEEREIRDFYHKSNYILFLSKQDNSPNQIMEAMSNGSIVIAFDNYFTRENIIDKHNGFLLPNNLSNYELFLKILEIFKNPHSMKISMNAYEYSKSQFSQEKMAYEYCKLLK